MSGMKIIPVYRQTLDYARAHGELEEYLTSLQADYSCRRAIETVLRENFDGMILKRQSAGQVTAQYGEERVAAVCAATLRGLAADARIGKDNLRWAASVPIPVETDILAADARWGSRVIGQPFLIDSFIRQFRQELAINKLRPSVLREIKEQATRPGTGKTEKSGQGVQREER